VPKLRWPFISFFVSYSSRLGTVDAVVFILGRTKKLQPGNGLLQPAVNILVTCTKRKTRPVPAGLRLGSVPAGPPAQRVRAWLGRLRSSREESVPAEAVYAGDSWNIIRMLSSGGPGAPAVRVWICSAGYGLLSLASEVRPYSATFDGGQTDSVAVNGQGGPPREASRAWWRLLSEWEGPGPHGPRTIAELADAHPRSPLLVVASEVYLGAVADDLRKGLGRLADPDQLSMISAGTSDLEGLSKHLLPCDARLQRLVGGARASLNARLARLALSSLDGREPTCSALGELFSGLLAEQQDAPSRRRTALADAEVRRYLKEALERDPKSRPTPLLRKLRDSGRACEQSRFASLFGAVREQLYGS
jgi:hypothetical protein